MKEGHLELDDYLAILERRSFLMVEVYELIQRAQSISIKIADNPVCATEKSSRRFIEFENRAEKGGKAWRWPAGGMDEFRFPVRATGARID